MANLKTPPKIFALDEFQGTQNNSVVSSSPLPANEGCFTSYNKFDGLSVHYCDVVESKPLTVSEQLPAGLSIDLILEGRVSFEVAGHQYAIESTSQSDLECSVCVLSRLEPFKLYVQQGIRIKKVNIFAEFAWLKKRFSNQVQLSALNQLFAKHAQVGSLKVSPEILLIASALAVIIEQHDVSQERVLEDKTMQLLTLCVKQFLSTDSELFSNTGSKSVSHNLSEQVSTLIANESAGQPVSLQKIANEVNLSVSTLQRRFKSVFGMTVIEYARIERLEKAKRALIDDDLSIGEVAYLSGYQHSSSFISAFTKQFGASPSRYKNTHNES